MKRNNIMNQPLRVIGMLVAISATMTASEAGYAAVSSGTNSGWYGNDNLSYVETLHYRSKKKGAETGNQKKQGSGNTQQKPVVNPPSQSAQKNVNHQTHASTSQPQPSYQKGPEQQSNVNAEINKLETQRRMSAEKLAELKKAEEAVATQLNEKPQDETLADSLNSIKKEKEDVKNQARQIGQKIESLAEEDTIFDDSLMTIVLNYATNYRYDNEAFLSDPNYKFRVRKAFANLYNRLPYRSAPLSREEDSGDNAVPRLTKDVFGTASAFAGLLDQHPVKTPVMGIRFRVEQNGKTCGVTDGFDGYFHVAVSNSARSDKWKTTLSMKDVFLKNTTDAIDICLKRSPTNETWWQYASSFGYNSVFSSERVFVKGISADETLKSNLTIQQMETILLLVRFGEVEFSRPGEDRYKLVLAGSESARQGLLNSLRAVRSGSETVLTKGGKVITAGDFGK